MNMGWACPKCGKVWAPLIPVCLDCNGGGLEGALVEPTPKPPKNPPWWWPPGWMEIPIPTYTRREPVMVFATC